MGFRDVPQTVVKTAGGGLFSTLWKVLSFLMKKWYLLLIIIFLISIVPGALVHSIQQKSFNPLILETGGRIMSASDIISLQIKNIKSNPQITYEEANKFTSSWQRFKFKIGKLSNYYILIINLMFLVSMFSVYYFGLSYIDHRNSVNIPLSLFILIAFEIMFSMLMYIKEKTGELPSTSLFLNSYTSILNIMILVILSFIGIAIFIATDVSKTVSNMIYGLIFFFIIFLLVGLFNITRNIDGFDIKTEKERFYPLKGLFFGENSLVNNWKIIAGKGYEDFLMKFPIKDINESLNINNETVKTMV